MLIDFKKPILDFSGEQMIWKQEQRDKVGEIAKPAVGLTLLIACQEALAAAFQDEQGLGQTEKVKRFMLGMKLASPLPVDISLEETGEILKLVSKFFPGSLVYPRVSEIFDAATKAKED